MNFKHDNVIKWTHFPRYWPFVRGIHRSPVNFPHKGQWRWALIFSLTYVRINGWVNNHESGDLRRHRAHYDVIIMRKSLSVTPPLGQTGISHTPWIHQANFCNCHYQYQPLSRSIALWTVSLITHYDVIRWKHFPRYWSFDVTSRFTIC